MSTDERVRRIRRRAAASRAAYAMHEKHPELAREAGAKGGAARVAQMVDPRAYGSWLARRRWHGALAGPAPTSAIAGNANGTADTVPQAKGDHDENSIATST